MFSLNYKVTTSTCDSEGKLKLFSALQMMQDCSEMWIDIEPQVKEYFAHENMAQLSSTQKRVSEISDDLNFASPSFFGKYFKRLTGLSPRAFREAEKPYVS